MNQNSKSVFLQSGWHCTSCDHVSIVYGPFAMPPQCLTCGAVATMKPVWNHEVTETVEVKNLGIPVIGG